MITESSLNRLIGFMLEYDSAIISAFVSKTQIKNCVNSKIKFPRGFQYSDSELKSLNYQHSSELKAKLLSLGYGVTKVFGQWWVDSNEGNFQKSKLTTIDDNHELFNIIGGLIKKYYPEKIEDEIGYFVVNINNDENFIENLKQLGALFCQNSILYIPKGGLINKGDEKSPKWFYKINGYLIYTNYENKLFSSDNIGFLHPIEGEISTKIKSRKFHFNEDKDLLDTKQNNTFMSQLAMRTKANKINENLIRLKKILNEKN